MLRLNTLAPIALTRAALPVAALRNAVVWPSSCQAAVTHRADMVQILPS